MLIRVVRQGDCLVLVLPKELFGVKDGAELELIQIKPGIYSLVSPLALAPAVKREAPPETSAGLVLSAEERMLLCKIADTPPEMRMLSEMKLDGNAQALLNSLLKRGLVFYSDTRYPKGVYGISRDVYEMVKPHAGGNGSAATGAASPPNAKPPLEKLSDRAGLRWDEHLVRFGYAVIENEGEAREASQKLEQELKSGDVLGTRGFDKKYYVAQKGFYGTWDRKILAALKGRQLGIDGVAQALGMSEVAARVALELMREQGDVIERKRGVYSPA